MAQKFLVKVKYEKMGEEGSVKKVTEQLLYEALSFGDAEQITMRECEMIGSFEIVSIKIYKVSEIFLNENTDKHFAVKVNFITLDEESGREKKTAVNILVQADDIKQARELFENGMKGSMADYEVEKIADAKISELLLL